MASDFSSSLRFFVLREDRPGGRYETNCDQSAPVLGDAPTCPECGLPTGSLTWLPPFRVELELYGESFGDFMRAGGNGFLVSEKFAETYRQEGLTGFSGYHPVEVVRAVKRSRKRKPFQVPRYLYVYSSFSPTAVDEARSHLDRDQPATCHWCRQAVLQAIRGFSIEEGSWTGEDVFRPRGLAGVHVASERFVHFVQQHGFTNVLLIPTEQYLFPRSLSMNPVH